MPDVELLRIDDDGQLVPVAEFADLSASNLAIGPMTIECSFSSAPAVGDSLLRTLSEPTRNAFTIEHPDGTVDEGRGAMTGVPMMLPDGAIGYECALTADLDTWTRKRPTTAALRRELRDRSASRARKCRVWAWLLYRRHHGC